MISNHFAPVRFMMPVILSAVLALSAMPAALAGTFQLVPNTTPTPVEISGKRYVIIKIDGNVLFKVAQPEGLQSIKWKFSNGNPVDGNGAGPHDIKYDKEAGWGAVNPVQIEVKRKVGDQNCNTPFKRVAAVVVPMIEPDTGQAGTNGDMVPSNKGATGEKHYVSPKKDAEFVTFKAKFGSEFAFGDALEWEGGEEVAGSPEKRKVSRAATGKTVLNIKRKNDGVEVARLNVWIVWADVQASKVSGPSILYIQNNTRSRVTAVWDFEATVQPVSIFTTADDIPDMTGGNETRVPNWDKPHAFDGNPLGDATYKWDLTRQWRERSLIPTLSTGDLNWPPGGSMSGTLPHSNLIQQTSPNTAANGYPADELEGNDDGGNDDNPYVTTGKLTESDSPTLSPANAAGTVGDTVESRIQFRVFVRAEINKKWYPISDYSPWRLHGKLKKADEAVDDQDYNGDGDKLDVLWIDNGSASDSTNNGW